MAKICIVCAHGGHLTEALLLQDAFEGHDVIFITYKGVRSELLDRKYLFDDPGMGYFKAIFKLLCCLPVLFNIIRKERPAVVVSTGGQIAIPVFYMAKLFGSKTIFIETWTKIRTPTLTGRVVYPVTDVFLVQWPELLTIYGGKAKYAGGIV